MKLTDIQDPQDTDDVEDVLILCGRTYDLYAFSKYERGSDPLRLSRIGEITVNETIPGLYHRYKSYLAIYTLRG